jgi:hypothetical protein
VPVTLVWGAMLLGCVPPAHVYRSWRWRQRTHGLRMSLMKFRSIDLQLNPRGMSYNWEIFSTEAITIYTNAPAVKRISKNQREESLPSTKMPCIETGRVPFNPKSVRVEKTHSSSLLSKNGCAGVQKENEKGALTLRSQQTTTPDSSAWFR